MPATGPLEDIHPLEPEACFFVLKPHAAQSSMSCLDISVKVGERVNTDSGVFLNSHRSYSQDGHCECNVSDPRKMGKNLQTDNL